MEKKSGRQNKMPTPWLQIQIFPGLLQEGLRQITAAKSSTKRGDSILYILFCGNFLNANEITRVQ